MTPQEIEYCKQHGCKRAYTITHFEPDESGFFTKSWQEIVPVEEKEDVKE